MALIRGLITRPRGFVEVGTFATSMVHTRGTDWFHRQGAGIHLGATMIRTTLVAVAAAAGLALAGCGDTAPPKPAAPAPAVAPAPASAPAPTPAQVEQKSPATTQKQQKPQKSTTQQQKTTKSPQTKSGTSTSTKTSDPYPKLPSSGGMKCQGGPDGATVCAGGSAEQNRKAEKQGDAEYKQFCAQQSTKPQMCQQMGY